MQLPPGTKPYIVTAGDPGMATAGSGDVLTGIIAAWLAKERSVKWGCFGWVSARI